MYRSLTLLVPEHLADDIASEMMYRGADGVEVEDSSVMLMPGKERPPEGQARLIGYFSPEARDPGLAEALGKMAGRSVEIFEEELPSKDWNEVWKSHFAPIELSPRLWVCPSWRLDEVPAEVKTLILDPGMAFGTGTHATTSLCLIVLDELLAARADESLDVLDVGTGSGILAIAAKLLGAGKVVATDNDPVALKVAAENAEINQVELVLSRKSPAALGAGPFPIVVANIMAHTLIELAPQLVSQVSEKGHLLLSGILNDQAEEVEAAFMAAGLSACERRVDGLWTLVHLRRE